MDYRWNLEPVVVREGAAEQRAKLKKITLQAILGIDVFRRAANIPVMILFVVLALIYLLEIPTRLLSWHPGACLIGIVQVLMGFWLMYLTYAATVDTVLGAKVWV